MDAELANSKVILHHVLDVLKAFINSMNLAYHAILHAQHVLALTLTNAIHAKTVMQYHIVILSLTSLQHVLNAMIQQKVFHSVNFVLLNAVKLKNMQVVQSHALNVSTVIISIIIIFVYLAMNLVELVDHLQPIVYLVLKVISYIMEIARNVMLLASDVVKIQMFVLLVVHTNTS